ncbi:zinc finger protein 362 isoform X3 [Anabrus simplex]|uniref:zinc finger protein 362 isoform X3 n=1 Tax=Anabrus simplex TaxID=316456 RepID=UPI0035A2C895
MSFIPQPVCRLCLWQTFPLTSIWSPILRELGIAKKINAIFPFTVERNDGLPSDICSHCTYKLDTFYEFYQLACVSHTKLRFCFPKGGEAHRSGLQAEKQEVIEIPSRVPSPSNHVDSEMPSAEHAGNFGSSGHDVGNHEQLPPHETERSHLEAEDDTWEDSQRTPRSSSVGQLLMDLPTPGTSSSSVGQLLVDLPTPGTRSSSLGQLVVDLPTPETSSSSVGQPTVDLPVPGTSCGKPASPTAADGLLMVSNSEGKKEKLLKCSHCRNEFKTRVEIALHFCDSPNNTPKRLSCRYCYRQFHDGATLAIHKKKHISQFTQTCGKCGKLFKTLKGFKSHINLCGSKSRDDISRPRTPQAPNHTCDLCNRQFYSVGGMKIHFSSREHRANVAKFSVKRKKLGVERRTEMETDQWERVATDSEHESNYYSEAEGTDDVFENQFSADNSGCSEPALTGSNAGDKNTSSMDSCEENKTKNHCLRRRTYSDSLWLVN